MAARAQDVSVKAVAKVGVTLLGLALAAWILMHSTVALSLTAAATLVAVALNHGVALLERKGLPRRSAVTMVLVGLVLALAGVFTVLIPPAVNQGRALVVQVPQWMAQAKETSLYRRLDHSFSLDERLEQFRNEALSHVQQAVTTSIRAVSDVLTALAAALTLFFLVIFMLVFGPRLVRTLLAEARADRRERYRRVLSKMYQSIGGYLSGLSLICLVNAVCTTLFLAIIRMPFFLPLGLLSGMSSLVPLVGNTLVGTVITLIAFAVGGIWKAAACAIFFIIYQQFENHVLGPVVYRRTVEVNPLVVVLALLFLTELAGIFGAILAVPAVAIGQVIVRELLRTRREQLDREALQTQELRGPPDAQAPV